jgi:hypothetical protein
MTADRKEELRRRIEARRRTKAAADLHDRLSSFFGDVEGWRVLPFEESDPCNDAIRTVMAQVHRDSQMTVLSDVPRSTMIGEVRRMLGARPPADDLLVGFSAPRTDGLVIMRNQLLADNAVPLLELDRDTLLVCGLDLRWGFMLERFERWGPVEHEMRFWDLPYN